MNTGLRGRSIPTAFATDDFQVLIVADKYQTGFDQPLLCGMYVDKRLSGVTAVQTLSRLNRTYAAGGKDRTCVLDFVNDPEDILSDFRVYFRDAQLDGTTDPDLVHDLRSKLDMAGIYTEADVEEFAQAYLDGPVQSAHTSSLKNAAATFNARFEAAEEAGNQTEIETLDLFRNDVGAFLRAYDFLSQIVNYEDTYLEKLSLFLRLLSRRLTGRMTTQPVDLSSVELAEIKQVNRGQVELRLADGEAEPLSPMKETGSGSAYDPKYAGLIEIIERINDLFGGEFTTGQVDAFQTGIVAELEENTHLRQQAAANSRSQFLQSPDLEDAVTRSMVGHYETQGDMVEKVFSNDGLKSQLIKLLGELAFDRLTGEQAS